jgi:formylglycine-generating enzyme required for sulfatase activity
MSVREFAAHLGISDRMVSKWEAGGETIRPRPLNQAALDTSLSLASADIRSRFTRIAIRQSIDSPDPDDDPGFARHLVRHPIDGKLMTLVEAGPFRAQTDRRPVWLPAYYIDVHAVTRLEFERFRAATDQPMEDGWDLDALLYSTGAPDLGDLGEPVMPIRKMLSARRAGQRPIRQGSRKNGSGPLTGVSREEALAYASWAAKRLPTVDQWDHAHQGLHGAIVSGVAEWCSGPAGLVRRGQARERTGFRCSMALGAMLNLLAI